MNKRRDRVRQQLPVSERRRMLALAALRVMEREGAWAATTRAVAAEADVPLGTVHYAFADKDELVTSVFDVDATSAFSRVREGAKSHGSARDALAAAFGCYVEGLRASPRRELVLQELSLMGARSAEHAEAARRGVCRYREGMEQVLVEVAESRGCRWQAAPPVIAELVIAQLFGLGQNWLIAPDDALLDACIEEMADHYAAYMVPIASKG